MHWNPDIETIDGKVHRDFLRLAYSYAWEHSDDNETKIGAVIVDPVSYETIAYGTNHFPTGVEPTPKQVQNRDWVIRNIIHAEPSAIFSAAKEGVSTRDRVMYMPWVPCTSCVNAIADSGIKTLVSHKEMVVKTPKRWWDDLENALELLDKCGVDEYMYSGKIGGSRIFS